MSLWPDSGQRGVNFNASGVLPSHATGGFLGEPAGAPNKRPRSADSECVIPPPPEFHHIHSKELKPRHNENYCGIKTEYILSFIQISDF